MSRQINYRRCFWIIFAFFTVFRLIIAGQFGLGMDESHYTLYARQPAWGYFDHPPMVAFLAWITTFFGENLFTLRLGPIFCWCVSIVLLRRLALSLYGHEKPAFWAVVLILLMPMQHLIAIALLPDATLNMFWCGTLLASWYAFRTRKWIYWISAGILFGLAMMSKYHGVLLGMCLLGYVLSSRTNRAWLKSPKPYVAVCVGLIVFLPNIIWNWKNDWISYQFQLSHGAGGGYYSLGKLLEMIGGQAAAASPVLLVLLIISWVILIKRRPIAEADLFVIWTSLPVFLFFCGIGLSGKVLPHWPAVGWWTGVLALAIVASRKIAADDSGSRRWRKWCIAGGLVGALMITAMYVAISFPVIEPMYRAVRKASITLNRKIPTIKVMEPFRSKIDISNDLYGWDEAASWVEQIRRESPEPEKTFVFCHRFFTTSQIKCFLDPETVATSLHRKPSQYNIWFKPQDYTGWNAVFVDDDHWLKGSERYRHLFKGVDSTSETRKILRNGRVAHTLTIYRYTGFKGAIEPRRK